MDRFLIGVIAALSCIVVPFVTMKVAEALEAPRSCQKVKVKGDVEYFVAFVQDGKWFVSTPDDPQQPKVAAGQVLTVTPESTLGVVVFRDDKNIQPFAYDWHVHGPTRQFCLVK